MPSQTPYGIYFGLVNPAIGCQNIFINVHQNYLAQNNITCTSTRAGFFYV